MELVAEELEAYLLELSQMLQDHIQSLSEAVEVQLAEQTEEAVDQTHLLDQ